MSGYFFLIPLSIALGLIGLATFLWTLRDNQYEDLDGARYRILSEDDFPLPVQQPVENSGTTIVSKQD